MSNMVFRVRGEHAVKRSLNGSGICGLSRFPQNDMCRRMGKPTICIGENKGADQLRSNRETD